MVTGGDIIHAPCTCKCYIHVNDGCDRSLLKKKEKNKNQQKKPESQRSHQSFILEGSDWSAVV